MPIRPPARHGWLGSIRVRIIAIVVGLLLVSSLGSVLLLRAVLFERLEEEVAVELDREAQEFLLLSNGNDPATGRPFAGDLPRIFDVYFDREIPDEGESLLAFVDGELYASRRAQDAGDNAQLDEVLTFWSRLTEQRRGAVDTQAGRARYVAVPLQGQGRRGTFVVANFPEFERAEIDEAVRTQAFIQLGTLVAASLAGVALAGRVLRPLRSLAATARRISETDMTQRIPETGHDEASQIAATFNDMMARLEAAFTSQRQFLDEASHELRTPLTIVRGHVELLELEDTPEARREVVELVTDEIDRMDRIVGDLFLLARAEHPGFLDLGPVDLRELVLDVHRKATALGPRSWQAEAPAPVWVQADRDRLAQALLQLADNAVKVTGPGDPIRFGVGRRGREALLWVHDGGPGIPPEDAGRIFRRFERGPAAHRTETPDRPGAGLGLTIVQAIAEAHGGRVTVAHHPEPGARFEIVLPAALP